MKINLLLRKIDEVKKQIEERRPLAPEEVKELDLYFKIGTTYSSNALEGNMLTLSETKIILEDGLSAGGKPLRDYYETVGHADAYDFMLEAARGDSFKLTEEIILRLHKLFYRRIEPDRAGRYRDIQVFITGTEYIPPAAKDVPVLMKELVCEINGRRDKEHPVLLAAFAHRKFAEIHPFTDGNGRTARLLTNLILLNRGYQIISIPPILRREYINALQAAQREKNPSDEDFVRLIAECEIEAQRDFCRMFRIKI